MDYRFVINDELTTSDGRKGRITCLSENAITIQDEAGNLHNLQGKYSVAINTKFMTEGDALYHATSSVNSSHCNFCGIAKFYSLELLNTDLLERLFPDRGRFIFQGVVNYFSREYSSCCYHLLPQIDGAFNQILIDEGLLLANSGFPKWTDLNPSKEFRNKQCRNLVNAIDGAEACGSLSKLSHVKSWITPDNVEVLRQLRNKLLHGLLTEVTEHDASLVVIMIQCLKHGLDGEA